MLAWSHSLIQRRIAWKALAIASKPKHCHHDNHDSLPMLAYCQSVYNAYTTRFDRMIKFHEHGFSSDNILACSSTIEVINRRRLCCVIYCAPLALQRLGQRARLLPSKLRLIIDRSLSAASKLMLTLRLARLAAALFNGIEIIGYTTRHWMGGNSFEAWTRRRTPCPGRVNDLLYMEYKHASEQLTSRILHRFKQCLPKENIDGEALLTLCQWNKANVLICDRLPADYTTIKLNQANILNTHMQAVCGALDDSQVKLFKIDVGPTYRQHANWFCLNRRLCRYKLNTLMYQLVSM